MDALEREIELKLKSFREREARQAGVPLFHIFTNDVIERLSRERPSTNIELLGIKGIGPQKAKRYGPQILQIIEGNGVAQSKIPEKKGKLSYTAVERDTDDGSKKERVYSVAEFLDHFNVSFARKPLAIHGEIFDSVDRRGANIYFRIKDRQEEAVLQCYMRASVEERLGVKLETGTEIVVSGFLGVYKPSGRFSLTVTEFVVHGEGLLKKAFEELEQKLSAEGLFLPERKRPLPNIIRSIALITAQGSDAEKDFITHVIKRGISVHRYDVRVEGLRSADQVSEAIAYANSSGNAYDVIVVTRGGGSLESLQSFNTERVARSIAGSRIPIISAIGHENDVTIADLVADVRASTPTHAGKVISEKWIEMDMILSEKTQRLSGHTESFLRQIDRFVERWQISLTSAMGRCIESRKLLLEQELRSVSKMAHQIFDKESQQKHILIQHGTHLNYAFERVRVEAESSLQTIGYSFEKRSRKIISHLNEMATFLHASNPERMLERGYSIIESKGKTISSVNNLAIGDEMTIRLKDGQVISDIQRIIPSSREEEP